MPSRRLSSLTMGLCLYIKSLLVVLLLHPAQAQGTTLPSPSPEFALPSLGDVMDAMKAIFMEAVKTPEDDGARTVFKQVVEELGPHQNITEWPPATADGAKDGLPAVVHEHADSDTTNIGDENAKQEHVYLKLNSSSQPLGLPDEQELIQGAGWNEKHVELIVRLNTSDETSMQEVDPVQISLQLDQMESTQKPKKSFKVKSDDRKHHEQDGSKYWLSESALEGVPVEQEQNKETHDTNGSGETKKADGWKKDMAVNMELKIQKGAQPQDQAQDLTQDNGGDVAKVVSDKEREAAAHDGKKVEGRFPVLKATEKTSQDLESATPKKNAWKIGVVAVAFVLIMQTLVTVTYILKCKRKPCSCAIPERECEAGIGPDDRADPDTDE